MNMFSLMIHLRLNLDSIIVSVLLFSVTLHSESHAHLPAELHNGLQFVIEGVFNEDRKNSEDEAKKLIRKFPEHPAGYFCMAFILDNWMLKYQSDKKEDEFYRYCDLTITKGERILLENKADEWAKFFIAGADGFKGSYEARYERWITAFRFGWKGVAVLLEMESAGCKIPDIYFGIGSYNYWRSALMKTLWWMPGINDKRQEAIGMLKEVCESGIYTGDIAAAVLLDILINEKMFEEALKIAEKKHKHYPEYMVFMWGKARAFFGLEKYDESSVILKELLHRCAEESPNNHFNEITYHLYLAKIGLIQNKNEQAVKECNIIKKYPLEGSVRKRLDPVFDEVKAIEKQVKQNSEKRKE